MRRRGKIKNQRGTTLIFLIGFGAVMATVATIVLTGAAESFIGSGRLHARIQAQYLAESGIQKAVEALLKNPDFSDDINFILGKGSVKVSVKRQVNQIIIDSAGYSPNAERPVKVAKIRANYMLESNNKLKFYEKAFN